MASWLKIVWRDVLMRVVLFVLKTLMDELDGDEGESGNGTDS